MSRSPHPIWYHTLRDLPTGFGANGVVIDGPSLQALIAPRAGLRGGALAVVHPGRPHPVVVR